MPITFFEDKKLFKLDAGCSTTVLSVAPEGYLLGLYWGAWIPDVPFDGYDFRDHASSFSPRNQTIGEGPFSPDTAPLAYSGFGTGDFRKCAVSIRGADGNDATDFRYVNHRIRSGKRAPLSMPGAWVSSPSQCDTLEIDMEDKTTGAELTLYYTAFRDYPVVTRCAVLKNASARPMEIEKISSASARFP